MTTAHPVHVLVRVWLPDRPGGLGQVASRIGAVRGDIVGVDVLERDGGIAIDEFAVNLPDADLLVMLAREIEQVDGTSVEEIRVVKNFPDPRLGALESASRLCAATRTPELWETLVSQVGEEFTAHWTALISNRTVLASTGSNIPSIDNLGVLALGIASSQVVSDGMGGPDDLAVAILPSHGATLLVGRDGHPFRKRERAQLLMLAKIADQTWTLVAGAVGRTPRREPSRPRVGP